jgi:hypothetical protein
LRIGRAVEDDVHAELFRPGQLRQVTHEEPSRAGFIAVPSHPSSDHVVAVNYVHFFCFPITGVAVILCLAIYLLFLIQ